MVGPSGTRIQNTNYVRDLGVNMSPDYTSTHEMFIISNSSIAGSMGRVGFWYFWSYEFS